LRRQIVTDSTGKKIIDRSRVAGTPFQKALGLMFTVRHDYALIFPFKEDAVVDLHMFFVFFPIDVLYLDASKVIVEKATLFPFTFYFPKNKARYVIELPRGVGDALPVGERLDFADL